MTKWPWAKLKTSEDLKIKTTPKAIRAMMPPFNTPVAICCGTKGQFIQESPKRG
jgi:hypothetical protein